MVPLDLGVIGELHFTRQIDHLVGVLLAGFCMDLFNRDTGVDTQITRDSLVDEVGSA